MICVKRVDTYKIYKTNNILQNTIKLKKKIINNSCLHLNF